MTKRTKILLSIFGTTTIVTATGVAISLTSCAETSNSTNNNTTPNDQNNGNNSGSSDSGNDSGNQPGKPAVTNLDSADINTNINFLNKSEEPGKTLNADNCVIKAGATIDKITAPQGYSKTSGYKTELSGVNPIVYLNLDITTNKFFQIRLPNIASQLFKADSLTQKNWQPNARITWTVTNNTFQITNTDILSNSKEYTGNVMYLDLTANITSGDNTCSVVLKFKIDKKA